MKRNGKTVDIPKVLRIAVGSLLAILLADLFGLKYSATAGIITLLSIQDTKKETLLGVVRRCISYVAAVGASYVIFHVFGFHPYSYGLFMLIFVAGSYYVGWQDVISTSAVVTTHFLTEQHYGWDVVGNELALLLIGTGVAVAMNLFVSDRSREIEAKIAHIDELLNQMLRDMAVYILRIDSSDFDGEDLKLLEMDIDATLESAVKNDNNIFLSDTIHYVHDINVRKAQCQVLQRIHDHMHHLAYVPEHAKQIAAFLERLSHTSDAKAQAEQLMREVHELMRENKRVPLPKNRIEFEDQAILYDVIEELEYFVLELLKEA